MVNTVYASKTPWYKKPSAIEWGLISALLAVAILATIQGVANPEPPACTQLKAETQHLAAVLEEEKYRVLDAGGTGATLDNTAWLRNVLVSLESEKRLACQK